MEPIRTRYLGYGALPVELTEVEIGILFALDPHLMKGVLEHRTTPNRLGLALQVCFIRMTGRTLHSTEMLSGEILSTLAEQLGLVPPMLASMRSLYGRRQTRYDHCKRAIEILGMRKPTGGVIRQLAAFLTVEASLALDSKRLQFSAMNWLHGRGYLLPSERKLSNLVTAARDRIETKAIWEITQKVPLEVRTAWIEQLTIRSVGKGTLFDELCSTPKGRGISLLESQASKIVSLKSMHAHDLDITCLSPALLAHYANRVSARPAGRLARTIEPLRTLELACFLRQRLLVLSDQLVQMTDHQIGRIWGRAYREAERTDRSIALQQQLLLKDFVAAIAHPDTDDAALGSLVRKRISEAGPLLQTSRLSRTREAFATSAVDLRRIAKTMFAMDLEQGLSPALSAANAVLKHPDHSSIAALFEAVGHSWRKLAVQNDRTNIATAAAIMILKRSLRNGKLGIVHSLDHRTPEHRLIPIDQWSKAKSRFVRERNVAGSADAFLNALTPVLSAGLEALAAGVRSGNLTIDDGRLIIPRLSADILPEGVDQTRRALFVQIGQVQLPDVLIETDAQTHFSTLLLGHAPNTVHELITLYAALLALGTNQPASAIAKMITGVEPRSITRIMERVSGNGSLRMASDDIVSHVSRHDVAKLWGTGISASADMLSLETAKHLWSARTDPRRGTPSIGTYTHILDQWAIMYDQPILLGRRQAGTAIEGALRQTVAPALSRIAVDTHGHTHFAMALAKHCGADLCPRLAGLSERKLFLPKGIPVPKELINIVSPSIDPATMTKGWDGFLRVAASVQSGQCPATYAMDWFGSAARGDAVYESGVAAGKLLLTLYLCDWLTKPDFQREIGRLLAQGEAVHTLQRAIHPRALPAKSGRDKSQLTATSNALTLLTNIIMAWNTRQFDEARTKYPTLLPDNHLRHIAPIAHAHINLNGTMKFDLKAHRQRLLATPDRESRYANDRELKVK
jgi:TnpA family transposase